MSVLPAERYFDDTQQVPDHWSVFGLRPNDGRDLKKNVLRRFRELAVVVHPDKNPGGDTLEQFQRLSLAKEVLVCDELRKKYVRRVERKCQLSLEEIAKGMVKGKPVVPPPQPVAATPTAKRRKTEKTTKKYSPGNYSSEQLSRFERALQRKLTSHPIGTSTTAPDAQQMFTAIDRTIVSRVRLGTIACGGAHIPVPLSSLYFSDPAKYWYLQFVSGQGDGHLLYCARAHTARLLFNEIWTTGGDR